MLETVRSLIPLSAPSAYLQDNPSFCSRLEFLPEGSLRIHPVLAQDAGHYLCLASNSAGSDRKGLDLRVLGRKAGKGGEGKVGGERWGGKGILLPSASTPAWVQGPRALILKRFRPKSSEEKGLPICSQSTHMLYTLP